jgi:predicted acylesterase/phospholipase RssA
VRESGKQADLLLRPPVRQFGLTDVKAFEKIVETGYQYARSELKRWLENTKATEQTID